MEEAYTALYQEFLRLRSLCLKQAAMLQHLTQALSNTQVANGDSDNLVSIPVQCTQDDLINFCSDAHQLVFSRQPPNQPAEANGAHGAHGFESPFSTGGGVTADILTSGMDQLRLTPLQPQSFPLGVRADPRPVLQEPSNPPGVGPQREPPSIIADLKRAEQQWAENNPTKARKPWSSSSFLDSEWQSLTGQRVMSRVTKVTRVCEFCQAVFPGHTTTRGEFLRHLTSHIT